MMKAIMLAQTVQQAAAVAVGLAECLQQLGVRTCKVRDQQSVSRFGPYNT